MKIPARASFTRCGPLLAGHTDFTRSAIRSSAAIESKRSRGTRCTSSGAITKRSKIVWLSLDRPANYSSGWLQRPQERDQILLLRRRQIEAERMAGNPAGLAVIAFEAGRDIVGIQARRIEPLFERHRRASVAERPAIPEAFQRWHLIEARPLMTVERVTRVDADV